MHRKSTTVEMLKQGKGHLFRLLFSDGEIVECRILDVLEAEDLVSFMLLNSNRVRPHYIDATESLGLTAKLGDVVACEPLEIG